MRIIQPDPPVIDEFSTRNGVEWNHSIFSNGFIEPDGTFVEREYQAAKAARSEDAARILACERPFGQGGAKKLGQLIEVRPDWKWVKYQIMAQLVMAKFHDHKELADQLLATGDALLVEGNIWHDDTWGDCKCGREECSAPGLNWLGGILMCVRESLRIQPQFR